MKKRALNKVLLVVVILAAVAVAVLFADVAEAQQPGESAVAKSNNCIGCHEIPGYRSSHPEVYPVPKIIGQSEEYLISALQAYRDGIREHPAMVANAAQLSDDDIAELAKYYAGGAK